MHANRKFKEKQLFFACVHIKKENEIMKSKSEAFFAKSLSKDGFLPRSHAFIIVCHVYRLIFKF